jgi:AraC-like DNA-binding protein
VSIRLDAMTEPETKPVAWDQTLAGWRQLYGNFSQAGFSVEAIEFTAETAVDWGGSFHEDSIEVCLNLTGRGTVEDRSRLVEFEGKTAGFYFTGKHDLQAERVASGRHAFITLEWSRDFLARQLTGLEDHVPGAVKQWLSKRAVKGAVCPVQTMTPELEQVYHGLRQPPVAVAAFPLWYQSKALELLALLMVRNGVVEEPFCHRQQRMARERIGKVVDVLKATLAEPPDLEALGRQAGCSPFYLSRLFSKEMKMTIPQYIRELRMQRAGELLRSGKFNVTEAALEVGYNSLSHFSKAFWDTYGCCPGLYPQGAKLFVRTKTLGKATDR